jgi:hypothetical protein
VRQGEQQPRTGFSVCGLDHDPSTGPLGELSPDLWIGEVAPADDAEEVATLDQRLRAAKRVSEHRPLTGEVDVLLG